MPHVVEDIVKVAGGQQGQVLAERDLASQYPRLEHAGLQYMGISCRDYLPTALQQCLVSDGIDLVSKALHVANLNQEDVQPVQAPLEEGHHQRLGPN
jgi:hypothetical protein